MRSLKSADGAATRLVLRDGTQLRYALGLLYPDGSIENAPTAKLRTYLGPSKLGYLLPEYRTQVRLSNVALRASICNVAKPDNDTLRFDTFGAHGYEVGDQVDVALNAIETGTRRQLTGSCCGGVGSTQWPTDAVIVGGFLYIALRTTGVAKFNLTTGAFVALCGNCDLSCYNRVYLVPTADGHNLYVLGSPGSNQLTVARINLDTFSIAETGGWSMPEQWSGQYGMDYVMGAGIVGNHLYVLTDYSYVVRFTIGHLTTSGRLLNLIGANANGRTAYAMKALGDRLYVVCQTPETDLTSYDYAFYELAEDDAGELYVASRATFWLPSSHTPLRDMEVTPNHVYWAAAETSNSYGETLMVVLNRSTNEVSRFNLEHPYGAFLSGWEWLKLFSYDAAKNRVLFACPSQENITQSNYMRSLVVSFDDTTLAKKVVLEQALPYYGCGCGDGHSMVCFSPLPNATGFYVLGATSNYNYAPTYLIQLTDDATILLINGQACAITEVGSTYFIVTKQGVLASCGIWACGAEAVGAALVTLAGVRTVCGYYHSSVQCNEVQLFTPTDPVLQPWYEHSQYGPFYIRGTLEPVEQGIPAQVSGSRNSGGTETGTPLEYIAPAGAKECVLIPSYSSFSNWPLLKVGEQGYWHVPDGGSSGPALNRIPTSPGRKMIFRVTSGSGLNVGWLC